MCKIIIGRRMEAVQTTLEEKGNVCERQQNFVGFDYAHAIEIDPQKNLLCGNRFHVFLKMQQHHLALENAVTTIQLKPDWNKSYHRKSKLEIHTFWISASSSLGQKSIELAAQRLEHPGGDERRFHSLDRGPARSHRR